MLPEAAHAGKVVLELSQLDLELPLGCDGVLGEDVEDQLRSVDHPRLESVFELALLYRRELVVDEQRFRAGAGEGLLQLDQLSLADVRARLRLGGALDELSDGLDPRRPRQLLQLGDLALRIDPLCEDGDDEPALGLGPRRRIGLA